jgi:TolB protein
MPVTRTTITALVLALALSFCGCHRPVQTLIPGQAKLTIDPGDTYSVLAIKVDGSAYNTISSGYGPQVDLRWSPNGKRLAWCGLAWGNWDVYVGEVGEARATMVSDDPAVDSCPAWSPDGSTIADVVALDKTRTKGDVAITALLKGTRRLVCADDLIRGSLDWAQKGDQQIAITTRKPEGWIVETMKADGTDRKQVAGPFKSVGKVTWSPDGAQIAIVAGTSLTLIPASGGSSRALTQDAEPTAAPRWSPDGSMIAFRGKSGYRVVKAADGAAVADSLPAPGGGSDPTWSPDNSQIAFVSTIAADNCVFVMNVQTKQVDTLATTED